MQLQRKKAAAALPAFELSGPPTTPLLGQLEHLAARVRSRELVGQDGRPEDC